MSSFGETTLEPSYGNFDRCDVVVTGKGDQEVDVRADFELPDSDELPQGDVEKHTGNLLAVVREKAEDDECGRVLVLSDHKNVRVEARHNHGSGMDVCGMAEAVTQKAIGVLGSGPIPRRTQPLPDTSLARLDACALLDNKALELIPGVDATHPEHSFGGWQCGWDSTTSDLSVALRFDRDQPLDASDGQPVRMAGRSAFVQSEDDGPGTCTARVVYRTFLDAHDDDAIELVQLVVSGPGKPASLCGLATKLSQAAAAKLPKA